MKPKDPATSHLQENANDENPASHANYNPPTGNNNNNNNLAGNYKEDEPSLPRTLHISPDTPLSAYKDESKIADYDDPTSFDW